MPPAPPDSSVGRASGPVGAARRIRRPGRSQRTGSSTLSDSNRHSGSGSEGHSKTSSALEALLVDLGSQIHRGVSQEAAETPRFYPTGLSALDACLGGGFPCGRLSEICGAPSSGRTSLALSLLAETLAGGVLAAWVDLADAFDPTSAALAGGDLERLLWVRARTEDEALRSCERLLGTEGFELVILDLASLPSNLPQTRRERPIRRPARRPAKQGHSRSGLQGRSDHAIRDTSWLRMARLAASTRTALVVLSNASATGSRAELVLEMKPISARFVGPPKLLDGLETTAVLQRHRSRPIGQEIPFLLRAEELRLDPNPDPSHRGAR